MGKEKTPNKTTLIIRLMHLETELSSEDFLNQFEDFLRKTCGDNWGYRFEADDRE